MTPQQKKWLDLIAVSSSQSRSMYAGQRVDLIPPRHLRMFIDRGWVNVVAPHNPVHKDYAVITDAGRAALAASQQ